ncbi:MAG TPA: hypothetical protein VN253_24330 [Kofleriaceae bacterium]|nr:hypothetical protein [Kofleriaceae bacterium]
MLRLIWLPALVLAACGTEDDRRPRTVEYLTEAILAPNCGNAQCHSQFRKESGYALDTVANARADLIGLVGPIQLDDRGEPQGSIGDQDTLMMNVLTRRKDPMPYDQPLPDADRELIRSWIERGARGAQCNPGVDGGKVCIGSKLYACLPTFDYGGQLEDCGAMSKNCAAGACR